MALVVGATFCGGCWGTSFLINVESAIGRWPFESEIKCATATNDRTIWVAEENKDLSCWDVKGTLLAKHRLSRAVNILRPSPDGSGGLIGADVEGNVFSAGRGDEDESVIVEKHCCHPSGVNDAASLGTSLLATVDRTEKIRISHWPRSYQVHSYLMGHRKTVMTLSFCGTSGKLVSGSNDECIREWDVGQSKCVRSWNTGKALHCVCASNDWTAYVWNNSSVVKFVDDLRPDIVCPGYVVDLAPVPDMDDEILALVDNFGVIKLNVKTGHTENVVTFPNASLHCSPPRKKRNTEVIL